MRSRLATTTATYALLSLAGSVPLFMPESVALPDDWGENAPAVIELRGMVRELRPSDETSGAARRPSRPFRIRFERSAESGLYVFPGDASDHVDLGAAAGQETVFELTASFMHQEGAGHIVRVSGVEQARISIDGRLVTDIGDARSAAPLIELDALEHLEDGRSYEIEFALGGCFGAAPPGFQIETSLRLWSEAPSALTSAAR